MTNGDFLIVTSQPASQLHFPCRKLIETTGIIGCMASHRSQDLLAELDSMLKLSMPRFRYQMGLKGFVFMSCHEEM